MKESKKNIPFSPPDIREEDIEEVVQALRSGWITTGPRTKELEKRLSEVTGTERSVCLNSATAGLELILRVLGIGEGDEVIVPAYTYTASASVVCHTGARLRLVDSLKGKYSPDPEQIRQAINERTKAVILVDLGGCMEDYASLLALAEEKKSLFRPESPLQEAIGRIAVIADAAHSLGAVRDSVKSGAAADFTAFSFHAVKNLTTAEGGAVTWRKDLPADHDLLYKEFQDFSLHGQTKDALSKMQLGSWEYDIRMPGYKCNMTDVLAALGLSQLKRYDEILKKRHKIVRRYDEVLRPLGVQSLSHEEKDAFSSAHLYMMRLPFGGEEERNLFIRRMAEEGIACNVHYKPLPMMTAYKKLGFSISDYPNAYEQYMREVTLPLNTCLSEEDVERILETAVQVLAELEAESKEKA